MRWTAILPIKEVGERKSRLAGRLSPEARAALSEHMVIHVIECLRQAEAIERIILLSPARPAYARTEWRKDEGRGLNAELAGLRTQLASSPLVVIHGDLPLLSPIDVAALVDGADMGCAIAPDRHGTGTNALAIAAGLPFAFAFGHGSCARHSMAAADKGRIVHRTGLSLDLDTPEDMDAAIAAGLKLPDGLTMIRDSQG
jgi:2-phospho-L-lactate guanylyltransferase